MFQMKPEEIVQVRMLCDLVARMPESVDRKGGSTPDEDESYVAARWALGSVASVIIPQLMDALKKERKQNQEFKDVLEHYANKDNWQIDEYGDSNIWMGDSDDGWEFAYVALRLAAGIPYDE